jgi:hypothetical protein
MSENTDEKQGVLVNVCFEPKSLNWQMLCLKENGLKHQMENDYERKKYRVLVPIFLGMGRMKRIKNPTRV